MATLTLEEDAPKKKPATVFGTTDTHLVIRHRDVPQDYMNEFVDGWTSGKRDERFGPTRHHKQQPSSHHWQYGYKLARAGRLYFTQALHSYLRWREDGGDESALGS
jgi:hypothetical protein